MSFFCVLPVTLCKTRQMLDLGLFHFIGISSNTMRFFQETFLWRKIFKSYFVINSIGLNWGKPKTGSKQHAWSLLIHNKHLYLQTQSEQTHQYKKRWLILVPQHLLSTSMCTVKMSLYTVGMQEWAVRTVQTLGVSIINRAGYLAAKFLSVHSIVSQKGRFAIASSIHAKKQVQIQASCCYHGQQHLLSSN